MKSETPKSDESPTKESSPASKSSVKIPESFQKEADALVASCENEHCVDYVSSCLSKKRSELYKSSDKPEEYTDTDMPKDS